MMLSNSAIFFVAISLFGAAVSLVSSAVEKSDNRLIDLDSNIRAQVFQPTSSTELPPLLSIPPFRRSLIPSLKSTRRYPNVAVPLFFAPQYITPLSKDLFSLADDMLKVFNSLFQFPPDMNYRDQMKEVQQLMDNGLVPEQYQGYAQAYLSLLRDQPVLRALEESVSKLQDSTSFNFAVSGKGLSNLSANYDFSLPDTMITPVVQSSFGIASNSETAAANAKPARVKKRKSSTKSSDHIEMNEDPFLHD